MKLLRAKELELRGEMKNLNEILVKHDSPGLGKVTESQIIKDGFIRSFQTRAQNVASELATLVKTSSDLQQVFDPDKTYIAQFPKDVLMKINSGEYDFLTTKSGETLSVIIDKSLPRNRNIVHNVRLAEMSPQAGENLRNVAQDVTGMAMQQQLAQLAETMADVQTTVHSIKRGQISDRLGLVLSGRRQLENAMSASAELRTALIQNAIQSLEDGRSQLEGFLRDELANVGEIPDSNWRIFFKCLLNSKYYDTCDVTFANFQESFRAFMEASFLLGMAYSELNDTVAISRVFSPTKDLIEEASTRVLALSRIVAKQDQKNEWYKEPQNLVGAIDRFAPTASLKSADVICIEMKGLALVGG